MCVLCVRVCVCCGCAHEHPTKHAQKHPKEHPKEHHKEKVRARVGALGGRPPPVPSLSRNTGRDRDTQGTAHRQGASPLGAFSHERSCMDASRNTPRNTPMSTPGNTSSSHAPCYMEASSSHEIWDRDRHRDTQAEEASRNTPRNTPRNTSCFPHTDTLVQAELRQSRVEASSSHEIWDRDKYRDPKEHPKEHDERGRDTHVEAQLREWRAAYALLEVCVCVCVRERERESEREKRERERVSGVLLTRCLRYVCVCVCEREREREKRERVACCLLVA
jgi:hypothetical protein